MSDIPTLTWWTGISLKETKNYILDCPKCNTWLDVTSIKTEAHIQCWCGNITFRPAYSPPWWAKTRNFILSTLWSLIIWVISWVVATIIYNS